MKTEILTFSSTYKSREIYQHIYQQETDQQGVQQRLHKNVAKFPMPTGHRLSRAGPYHFDQ